MDKIKIIEAGNELGLGGTEYVIQLYSKYLDRTRFDVTVVAIREGGPRVKIIEEMGIKVVILYNDLDLFAEMLKNTDVLHWHGYGTLDPNIFNVIKINKPKLVIQTNIFGAYSYSLLYNIIDYDLYVSKMILIRRMMADEKLKDNFSYKRKALANPVDVDHIQSLQPSEKHLNNFKKQNHLNDYFIVGRIGRPDNAKFDLVTLDAFAIFSNYIQNTKFLLVGATPKILAYAESLGISDKICVFENTPELRTLLMYYLSIDVFLAVSEFGETFGMVIAEAMAAGIPVVTVSTPRRDNAQIELVDNMKTGLVTNEDPYSIAQAILYLYNKPDLRKELAEAAQSKVKKEYKANDIVHTLEELILNHLKNRNGHSKARRLVSYSSEIIDDYIFRCHNLWTPEGTIDN